MTREQVDALASWIASAKLPAGFKIFATPDPTAPEGECPLTFAAVSPERAAAIEHAVRAPGFLLPLLSRQQSPKIGRLPPP